MICVVALARLASGSALAMTSICRYSRLARVDPIMVRFREWPVRALPKMAIFRFAVQYLAAQRGWQTLADK